MFSLLFRCCHHAPRHRRLLLSHRALLLPWMFTTGCVVFEDAATTRRAIAGCGHPLTAEELSTAPDSMDETMGELDAAASIPMLWHKGRDFIKHVQGKDVKVRPCS